MQDLAQKAVSHALKGEWKEAIELNKKILVDNPSDIDALNRTARACAESGKIQKAKTFASKVLKLDPSNSIAKKSLDKWKNLNAKDIIKTKPAQTHSFLEEPGKTKIVGLLRLGSRQTLAKLDTGDEVKLTSHGHRISIFTSSGDYVGRIPDDLSARLRKLAQYGNEYQVLIKSVDKTAIRVFIREVKRAAKLSDIPSFSSEKIDYISFTPPELVHNKDEIREQIEEAIEHS